MMARSESSLPSALADMAALGKLWEEHAPKLLAMVRRRIDPALETRIDPEDVLSDAFLEARRRWDRYKQQPALTPYAWAYRIVLDCLIEAWRKQTRDCRDLRRDLPFPEGTSVQLGLSLVHPGTSPSEAAAREEVRRRMQRTLELLKETDREILWMRHYDELTFGEAAEVLGITENAATVRYVRALRRVKEMWQ